MGDAPRISIVLPTYNGAKYLHEAVQSCLDQTLADWELIIVDDCSTDQTPALAASWTGKDGRISFVRHEVNQKTPGALNTGFARARGGYCTWISDDNRFLPRAIQEMAEFLDAHPDVGVVYADYELIDGVGAHCGRMPAGQVQDLGIECSIGPCFLYRREVHAKVGGYMLEAWPSDDYEFWLRASCVCRMTPLRRELYQFRVHPGGMSQAQAGRVYRAMEGCLKRNLPRLPWMDDEGRAQAYLMMALRARNWGRPLAAAAHLCRALDCCGPYVLQRAPRWILADTLLGKALANRLRRLLKRPAAGTEG